MSRSFLPLLCLPPLLTLPSAAIEIRLDYRFDTTNFFDTPEKRAVMEEVADFFGSILQDNLLQIDPAEFTENWVAVPRNPTTGGSEELENLVVPEDTIIVFLGSRQLGGTVRGQGGPGGFSAGGSFEWISRLRARGNPGADFNSENADQRTDHAPWGGSISFDSDTTFNFSRDGGAGGIDFIPVALHEMAHVLGIGLVPSWHNRIQNGFFTGPAASRSAGFDPPVESGGGHFAGPTLDSPSFGSFSREHGSPGPVLMLASATTGGGLLNVASDLDLAALSDIGWEVVPPPGLKIDSLGPASASFTWPTSSFISYRLERGSSPAAFDGGSGDLAGNAQIQSWSDPAPLPERAFYRLRTTPIPEPVTMSSATRQAAEKSGKEGWSTVVVEPLTANSCFCGGSH